MIHSLQTITFHYFRTGNEYSFLATISFFKTTEFLLSIVNIIMSWKFILLKCFKDIFNNKTSYSNSTRLFLLPTFLSTYNPIKPASSSFSESFWEIMELNSIRWLIIVEVLQFRLILCTGISIKSDRVNSYAMRKSIISIGLYGLIFLWDSVLN